MFPWEKSLSFLGASLLLRLNGFGQQHCLLISPILLWL